MKQKCKTYALLWPCFALALSSCGQMPEFHPRSDAGPLPAIVHPQSENEALPGSYLVVMRSQSLTNSMRFSNFSNEYRFHSDRYLELGLEQDPDITHWQFLSSVPMGPSKRGPSASQFYSPMQKFAEYFGEEDSTGVLLRVDFKDSETAKARLENWKSDDKIFFAEPNYYNYLSQASSPSPTPTTAASSPYVTTISNADYWWFKSTKLAEAYQALGSPEIKNAPIVAVLDSGLDYMHPALARAKWENTAVGAAGCSGDQFGCNATTSVKGSLGDGDVAPFGAGGPGIACPTPEDANGNCWHGTHVAGIIAASPTDSSKNVGVCQFCRILPVRIIGSNEGKAGALDSSIIAGLKYVTLFSSGGSNAIRVVNASFGKYTRSRAVALLVRLLKDNGNGTIVIAAASNEDSMLLTYPASLPEAVAVAAVTENSHKAPFSNFGSWVDISAPGNNIESTMPGGGSSAHSGTSMAAPMVAGLAGLIVGANPGISIDELRDRLLLTANPDLYTKNPADGSPDTFNENYYPTIKGETIPQPLLGYGLMDAKAAVTNTKSANGRVAYSGLNRVNGQCGLINSRKGSFPLTILGVLLLPLLVVCFRRGFRVNITK